MRPFDIFLLIYVVIWLTILYGFVQAHNTASLVLVFGLGLLVLFFLLWLRAKF